MKCFRCENNMYYERFFDQQGNFWGWKCLFCGEIIDEVILDNRIHFRGYDMVHHRRKRKGLRKEVISYAIKFLKWEPVNEISTFYIGVI